MRAPSPYRKNNSGKNKINHYWRGMIAEYIAMIYLMCKGYRIRAHRYKTSVGEIDIIATKKNILVAVEVKYRDNINDAFGAISPASQKRIINTMKWYMNKNPRHDYATIRMDMIAIDRRFSIKHLDNAWQDNP